MCKPTPNQRNKSLKTNSVQLENRGGQETEDLQPTKDSKDDAGDDEVLQLPAEPVSHRFFQREV